MIQLTYKEKNKENEGPALVGVFFCSEIGQPNNQRQRSLEAVRMNSTLSIIDIINSCPITFGKQAEYIGCCLEKQWSRIRVQGKNVLAQSKDLDYESIKILIGEIVTKNTSPKEQILFEISTFGSPN